MSLEDAVLRAGVIPDLAAPRALKKAYSERLSRELAYEMATSLRNRGFRNVKSLNGGPGEKTFQGGLGPKRVDVSFSDEQNGLLLATSIKTISFAPFSKNLKNRFADMCTESISLHLRFPYAVVTGLFAFPLDADSDTPAIQGSSTFRRALKLFHTISGRREYTDPGEKFENITLMLYQPLTATPAPVDSAFFDAETGDRLTETEYLERLHFMYNQRNPHAAIADPDLL